LFPALVVQILTAENLVLLGSWYSVFAHRYHRWMLRCIGLGSMERQTFAFCALVLANSAVILHSVVYAVGILPSSGSKQEHLFFAALWLPPMFYTLAVKSVFTSVFLSFLSESLWANNPDIFNLVGQSKPPVTTVCPLISLDADTGPCGLSARSGDYARGPSPEAAEVRLRNACPDDAGDPAVPRQSVLKSEVSVGSWLSQRSSNQILGRPKARSIYSVVARDTARLSTACGACLSVPDPRLSVGSVVSRLSVRSRVGLGDGRESTRRDSVARDSVARSTVSRSPISRRPRVSFRSEHFVDVSPPSFASRDVGVAKENSTAAAPRLSGKCLTEPCPERLETCDIGDLKVELLQQGHKFFAIGVGCMLPLMGLLAFVLKVHRFVYHVGDVSRCIGGESDDRAISESGGDPPGSTATNFSEHFMGCGWSGVYTVYYLLVTFMLWEFAWLLVCHMLLLKSINVVMCTNIIAFRQMWIEFYELIDDFDMGAGSIPGSKRDVMNLGVHSGICSGVAHLSNSKDAPEQLPRGGTQASGRAQQQSPDISRSKVPSDASRIHLEGVSEEMRNAAQYGQMRAVVRERFLSLERVSHFFQERCSATDILLWYCNHITLLSCLGNSVIWVVSMNQMYTMIYRALPFIVALALVSIILLQSLAVSNDFYLSAIDSICLFQQQQVSTFLFGDPLTIDTVLRRAPVGFRLVHTFLLNKSWVSLFVTRCVTVIFALLTFFGSTR